MRAATLVWPLGIGVGDVQGSCVGVRESLNTFDM